MRMLRTGKKYKLEKYKETKGDDQKWVKISKIVVPSEYDKEQLLEAFKYIHDGDINTDFLAVNTIAHMYCAPDKIEVETERNKLKLDLPLKAVAGLIVDRYERRICDLNGMMASWVAKDLAEHIVERVNREDNIKIACYEAAKVNTNLKCDGEDK